MGTDNLFHKRKAKKDKDLKRRKSKRDLYDFVLIVCEGDKTEPLYLKEMIKDFRLNTANVEICGRECGSSPDSVHKFAKDRLKQSKDYKDPYDKIFCVFDKDAHAHFQAVFKEISEHKVIDAIVSVPCFEFWLLLHFTYSDSPYSASGDKSVCDQVIKELTAFFPSYQKNHPNAYAQTKSRLSDAIRSSKAIKASAERNQTDNPSTQFHLLVEYLQNLKKT